MQDLERSVGVRDDDESTESFIEVPTKPKPKPNKSSKSRSKKSKSTRDQDSDQEPDRQPLGAQFIINKENLRKQNHPTANMAAGYLKDRKRQASKSGSKASKSNKKRRGDRVRKVKDPDICSRSDQEYSGSEPEYSDSDSDDEQPKSGTDAPNSVAKAKVIADLKRELKIAEAVSKLSEREQTQGAIGKLVFERTTTDVFKHMKLVENDKQLNKCAKYLATRLLPKDLGIDFHEMEEGEEKDLRMQIWVVRYRIWIRKGMNHKRSYYSGEMKKAYDKDVFGLPSGTGPFLKFPDEGNALDMALRMVGMHEFEMKVDGVIRTSPLEWVMAMAQKDEDQWKKALPKFLKAVRKCFVPPPEDDDATTVGGQEEGRASRSKSNKSGSKDKDKEADGQDPAAEVDDPDESALDLETWQAHQEASEAIYDNWVDKIVPRIAGNAHFPDTVRYYLPMIEAVTRYCTKYPHDGDVSVTPSDLSMAVLMIKNFLPKWEWSSKLTLKSLQKGTGENKDSMTYTDERGETGYYEEPPEHPFTSSKEGSKSKYGGWNARSRALYERIKDLIKYMQKHDRDRIVAVDLACLARLRKANNMDEKDRKKKRTKRKQDPMPEVDMNSDVEDIFNV